ncbi:hypothetical protein AgCh_011612 [Apium graveolens]
MARQLSMTFFGKVIEGICLGVYKVHQDTKTFLSEKKGLTKEDIDEGLCSDNCALDQFGNKSIMSAASFSAPVAGSTYVGLKPIPPKLFQMKDSVAWNRKTVSNGSKTHCMKTWNPIDNKKFETLSYLPPLTDDSIAREIDYMMKKGWIPCLEFDALGYIYRENNRIPNYYDGRYWTMWKLPMFGCTDASQVLHEITECKKAYPSAYIRCQAFDNIRQAQCMSFVIQKPTTTS